MSEEKLSLLRSCAQQYQMEPAAFAAAVKATVFPGGNATNEQLAAFLAVAQQYGLNPFLKQVYAFPSKGGGIVPMVGVDGWAAILNQQPQLDGIEFDDRLENGRLAAVTCRLYRKDRSRATQVTEYMAECARDTEPWKKWPLRMLRHKALVQCARYAFALAGIYDEDEAERIMASERPGPNAGPVIDIAKPAIPTAAAAAARDANTTDADPSPAVPGSEGVDAESAPF